VFFRLLINGGADGGGTAVTVRTYDSLPANERHALWQRLAPAAKVPVTTQQAH
jgi:hypothetical protein